MLEIEAVSSGSPRFFKTWIIGESWGKEEEQARAPFVGQSGQELTRILAEAGINRQFCFITNVINMHPQDNEAWRFFFSKKEPNAGEFRGLYPRKEVLDSLASLYSLIYACQPQLIIAVGNYALWALTAHSKPTTAKDKNQKPVPGMLAPSGIGNWRGSQTWFKPIPGIVSVPAQMPIPVLPIYHPAAIMRDWSLRAVTVHDLRARVPKSYSIESWDKPKFVFLAPPTFSQACSFFDSVLHQAAKGPMKLAVDIETLKPLLVCVGFAPSSSIAMSLPFVRISNSSARKENVQFDSYWRIEEERVLIKYVRRILTHPNIDIVGQNFIYDTQYLEEEFGVIPRLRFDTMLMHHLIFPGTPKGLDYLSSLYCDHHLYWKEDGKDWHINDDLESQLRYNCEDCVRTFEIASELEDVITQLRMQSQWREVLHAHEIAASMTRRGVLIDQAERKRQLLSVMMQKQKIEEWILARFPQSIAGDPNNTKTLWFKSPKQTAEFFYNKEWGLGLTPVASRLTGNTSTGKEAIEELRHKYPRLLRLFDSIQALRSLEVFRSHFLAAPLDPDGRMRCTYGPAGTETFRYNSSENAFGRGTNLQNIPSGNEE
jgi:uracil-DNA glycosylase